MKLPRHPFAVRGRIAQCWLFVYRTPLAAVRELLPPTLEPATHGGFAFWNIVVSRLDGMRPPPLPEWIGLGYWHVAYRLHARATGSDGTPIEGLFFVRSDCDRRIVARVGNALTDFNFHVARIRVEEREGTVRGTITSLDAAAHFRIDQRLSPGLTAGSPFASIDEAARALAYKPRALAPCGPDALKVVRVVRDDAAWRWKLAAVAEADWQFLTGREATLELCYEVEPIEYLWERGQVVPVQPCAS